MKTIRYAAPLFYYDGVQIFEGRDAIGGYYVALLVETQTEGDRYLVVGVEPERLRQFRIGTLDLSCLLSERPEKEWYLASVLGPLDAEIPLILQDRGDIPIEYLPEPGFVLHSFVAYEGATLLKESRARNNFILEMTLKPSGIRTGPSDPCEDTQRSVGEFPVIGQVCVPQICTRHQRENSLA